MDLTDTPNPPSASPANTNDATTLPARQESLQQYLQAATTDNTRKAYRSAIRQFEKWGGRLPCRSRDIVDYLLSRAQQLNPRTLDLHLTAIGQWHRFQNIANPVQDPLVQKTMEGIRRSHGSAPRKARALRLEQIATMTRHLQQQGDSLRALRDQALLLIAFFGAFRRSELVGIRVSDLTWEEEGLLIRLPRSKTDQEGSGIYRALPYGATSACPCRALKTWLTRAQITEGPVFRAINRWDQLQQKPLAPASINTLLKTIARDCGFDFADALSSHSFRRGLSTSAAREKVDFELIKKQGGWKSDRTVWGYIEEGQRHTDNANHVLMEKLEELL